MTNYYFTETLANGTLDYIKESMDYLNHLEILTKDSKVLTDFVEDIKDLLDSVLTDFEIASKTTIEDLKSIIAEKERN
ncbi:MAG: hypothetical protein LUH05_04045 [Candidatus Gastranaerophilales bacterium]|nr:hypothetical protein [Candidatus Gastranaerophilales bacterium]